MKNFLYYLLLFLFVAIGFSISYESGEARGRKENLEDLLEVEAEYTRVLGEYVALQKEHDSLVTWCEEKGYLTRKSPK